MKVKDETVREERRMRGGARKVGNNPSEWWKQAAKPVIGSRAEYREDREPNFLKKIVSLRSRGVWPLSNVKYTVTESRKLGRVISFAADNERIARGDSGTIEANFS